MNIRYEWVTLGVGPSQDNAAENVLDSVLGAAAVLTVSTTATTAGSRPTAPTLSGRGPAYARVTAIDGNAVVAWGSNPTASQTNGVLVMEGGVELIPVTTGEKLSFVELVTA